MAEKKRPPGLYRRGRVWWVKYYVNGRPVRESTATEKEGEAKRFLDKQRGAVAVGAPILPRADRVRYDEAAKDLRANYAATGTRGLVESETRFAHLDAFFRGRRLAAIGGADVVGYVQRRQAEGAANGTINRELGVLSRLCRLAYEHGKLLRLPVIRKLKEAAPRQGFFEREQFEAVRRRLPADLVCAITLAHTFGWRMQSEILTLERRQLDLAAGTLRLEPGHTKNDDARTVFLTPETKALLAEQMERVRALERQLGRIVPSLFPHLRGKRRGQPRRDFRKAWATACKRAGVPGMLRHDFRRTAVRNLVNAGVAERVAMKITGHRTRSVFDRYHIVSPGDLQEASRRLAGTIPGTINPVAIAPRAASSDNLSTRP